MPTAERVRRANSEIIADRAIKDRTAHVLRQSELQGVDAELHHPPQQVVESFLTLADWLSHVTGDARWKRHGAIVAGLAHAMADEGFS